MERIEKEAEECPVCMVTWVMVTPIRLILKLFSKLQKMISCRGKL